MNHFAPVPSQRLDQYVTEALAPDVSRAFAARLIESGKVTVNGIVAEKAGYKIKPDDTIKIDYIHELVEAPAIELPVLYEDADCVVINKPVGILVHSKGAHNPEATVATWLRAKIVDDDSSNRAGIVHRLDRATSGVMICAKSTAALSALQKQFSERNAKKIYYAVVAGHPKQPAAIIDMPIERNPKQPAMFRVGPNGKPATTQYSVLQQSEHYSLLELKPTTGRTHQLRVHLKQLDHPIVGDTFYDGPPANRLFLHAASLELTLPNRQRKTFEAPIPADFKDLLNHDIAATR